MEQIEFRPFGFLQAGKSRLRAALQAALRLPFPPNCPGCGRLTADHRALCPTCWQTVRFIERPYCEMLGIPFSHDLGKGILSAEAIANPPVFDRLRSAVLFQGVARNLVHGLKYKDRTELAPMMAEWMVTASDGFVKSAEAIMPVPLHPRRLFFRKYNQAGELARHIAGLGGVALLPSALICKKNTARQVGLSVNKRQDNVRGAFQVTDQGRSDVFGRHVLLVDDVYTTGATVAAASRVLRSAGAKEITVLTFAMALPDTI